MNKILINSEAEFVEFMLSKGYWNNPELKVKIPSWISLPEKYPCVLAHTWGRETEDLEFIYIEDFGLEQCACGKLVESDSMRWSDGKGAALCEDCHEEYYK